MRIAILGAHGQLGGELRQRLGSESVPFSRHEIDITSQARLEGALTYAKVDAVVNCAAFNGVDLAESEPEAALWGNALGPRLIAAYCEQQNLPFVHISTDYVFGLDAQRKTPYRETDLPGPQGVYAVSKLAGEELVRAGCQKHFILRTCGLYGSRGQSGKRNFVETMLKLGPEKPELKIVSDQRCTPTSTKDLAEVIVALLETTSYGTYHVTNAGDCSWAEFATEIFRQAKLSPKVIPITTTEYAAKAPRPPYSVLDSGKVTGVIGKPMRPWQEALATYLNERKT